MNENTVPSPIECLVLSLATPGKLQPPAAAQQGRLYHRYVKAW